MFRLIPVLFCLLFYGCTIIKISGATPSVEYHFGIAKVSMEDDKQSPLVIAINSMGIIKTPNSISIGYIKEFLSKFPDPAQCNTLIVVDNANDLNSIKEILQEKSSEINSLCISSKDGHSWSHQKSFP